MPPRTAPLAFTVGLFGIAVGLWQRDIGKASLFGALFLFGLWVQWWERERNG